MTAHSRNVMSHAHVRYSGDSRFPTMISRFGFLSAFFEVSLHYLSSTNHASVPLPYYSFPLLVTYLPHVLQFFSKSRSSFTPFSSFLFGCISSPPLDVARISAYHYSTAYISLSHIRPSSLRLSCVRKSSNGNSHLTPPTFFCVTPSELCTLLYILNNHFIRLRWVSQLFEKNSDSAPIRFQVAGSLILPAVPQTKYAFLQVC